MNTTNRTKNFSMLLAWMVLCSACATPTQQLLDEALVTEDWAEFERRQARESSMQCGRDEMVYCKTTGRLAKRNCSCESYADVENALP